MIDVSVPTSGIEQITAITGGVPAKYGDATGGIIAVTSKGPSSKISGGFEYETSALFDSYNHLQMLILQQDLCFLL